MTQATLMKQRAQLLLVAFVAGVDSNQRQTPQQLALRLGNAFRKNSHSGRFLFPANSGNPFETRRASQAIFALGFAALQKDEGHYARGDLVRNGHVGVELHGLARTNCRLASPKVKHIEHPQEAKSSKQGFQNTMEHCEI